MILAPLLILLLVSSSLSASDDFGFPLEHEHGSACLDAAQKWIKREMLSPSKESMGKAYAFNTAFSKCLWETKDAKEIKWPSSYQSLKDSSTLSWPMKDEAGNWTILTARPFSESYTQTYLLLKKDGTTKAFSGPNLRSYFAGIEQRPHTLNSKTQAIEVLSAYISEYGSSISSAFIGLDDQMFLQTTKESVGNNGLTKLLIHRTCKHSIEPDPRNVLGKIIETCDSEEVQSGKKLESVKKVFQWNGVQYTEEEPEEWLAKLKEKPKPKPIIITTKKRSPLKQMGSLSYVVWTKTQKPKGSSGSATEEWFELKSGANEKILKLLNEEVRKLSAHQNIFLIETDDSSFGTSAGTITPVHFAHDILTVKSSSYSEAPESRSFDSAAHSSYDLRTGRRVDLEASFKSFQDRIHFHLWIWNHLKKNISDVFPGLPEFTVIFKEKGPEILLEDDSGGHYVSESLGEIPYDIIPRGWFKEGSMLSFLTKGPVYKPTYVILKPVVNCERADDEVLKKICASNLRVSYEENLLRWERRLEQKVKSQEDLDTFIEDFSRFKTKFQTCSDRICMEKLILLPIE